MRRAVLLSIVFAGACDLMRDEPAAVDAAVGPDGWPPPRTDVVPPVGGPDTLDLATWNIENFPKSDRTIGVAADLIASLDLDLVVCEEIASVTAWDELVARLPDHAGVLSSHRYTPTDYQKIGVLYREDLITASTGELLFVDDPYAFPRPPLLVHLTLAGGATLDVVGVHLKAGTAPEDRDRRAAAVRALDTWLRAQVDAGGEDEIVVLGDFNATLDPARDDLAQVWPPIVDAPDRYRIRTTELEAADQTSFLPSGVILDHIVTTAGLADEIGTRAAVIPDVAATVVRYEADVSDHVPVALTFPLPE